MPNDVNFPEHLSSSRTEHSTECLMTSILTNKVALKSFLVFIWWNLYEAFLETLRSFGLQLGLALHACLTLGSPNCNWPSLQIFSQAVSDACMNAYVLFILKSSFMVAGCTDSCLPNICSPDNCSPDNCSLDNCSLDNCSLDNCSLDTIRVAYSCQPLKAILRVTIKNIRKYPIGCYTSNIIGSIDRNSSWEGALIGRALVKLFLFGVGSC